VSFAKVRNWDRELVEWAGAVVGEPFVWGRTDCASLVRRAHQLMLDYDVFADIPTYDSEIGAARAKIEHGGVTEAMEARGATRFPITMARAGDIVITQRVEPEDITLSCFILISGEHALATNPGQAVELVPVPLLWGEAGYCLRMPR
jgi:hypothetical protein